jgi:hypothetical protein
MLVLKINKYFKHSLSIEEVSGGGEGPGTLHPPDTALIRTAASMIDRSFFVFVLTRVRFVDKKLRARVTRFTMPL